jgi:hypothetical protein
MPSFGSDVERTFDTGTHVFCDDATSNPAGQVALGFGGAFSVGIGTRYDLYAAGGAPQNVSLGPVIGTEHAVIDPWFHPTGAGYQGLYHEPGLEPPQVLRSWDAAGTSLGDSTRFAVSSAPTVDGASIVLGQEFDATRMPSLGATHLDWTDASGHVTQSVPLDRAPDHLLQAFGTRHVAVLDATSTPWKARWFDAAGAPLTAWFDVGGSTQGGGPYLQLLADATTVALSDGASWVAVLRDGVASADAAPSWLASRAGTRFAKIRQGTGYAVLALPRAEAARFEVLTAAGDSCGFVTVPAPAPPNGQTWTPQRLDVGGDGTLFQVVNRTGGDLDGSVHCAFRWWPGLLR